MIVYYTVIISICVLAMIDFQTSNEHCYVMGYRKMQKWIASIIIVILSLVAGLRYNVGTDYHNYYVSYNDFKNVSLQLNDEPGIKVIARIASFIYDDPGTMMFLAAVITVILLTVTIVRNSEMCWLSLMLYVLLCCWHGCFNGVRQYLAAAILFAGHYFIKEKKLVFWCMVVFVASMFHVTAVIGLVFYFFPRIKISFKQIVLSIIFIYIGMQAYDRIFGFIGFLKSDTFDFVGQGSGYLTNSISPFRILVAWVPVIFFWIFNRYYNKEEEKFKFYINMSLLHAIFMTAAINSTYLGRIGIYTGVYNTLTWPLLIKKVEPRSQKILIIIMLFFYFLYWHTEASGSTLVNFRWIFQR